MLFKNAHHMGLVFWCPSADPCFPRMCKFQVSFLLTFPPQIVGIITKWQREKMTNGNANVGNVGCHQNNKKRGQTNIWKLIFSWTNCILFVFLLLKKLKKTFKNYSYILTFNLDRTVMTFIIHHKTLNLTLFNMNIHILFHCNVNCVDMKSC